MSMSDDVGNMVAGGVAAGVAAGLQYQRDAQAARSDDVARSWKRYAEQLEDKVHDRDVAIATKNVELARKDNELASKDLALAAAQASVVDLEAYKNLTRLLRNREKELERTLRRSSVNSAVFNVLLERLVAEIEDAAKFPSLDPAVRQEIIASEWARFEATGELEFEPRIAISPRRP